MRHRHVTKTCDKDMWQRHVTKTCDKDMWQRQTDMMVRTHSSGSQTRKTSFHLVITSQFVVRVWFGGHHCHFWDSSQLTDWHSSSYCVIVKPGPSHSCQLCGRGQVEGSPRMQWNWLIFICCCFYMLLLLFGPFLFGPFLFGPLFIQQLLFR